jgi:hypothetical protein
VRVEDGTRQRESGGWEGREDLNPTFVREWRARRERGRGRDTYPRELGGKGAVTLGIGGRTTGARARACAAVACTSGAWPRGEARFGRITGARLREESCTPRDWLGREASEPNTATVHPTGLVGGNTPNQSHPWFL